MKKAFLIIAFLYPFGLRAQSTDKYEIHKKILEDVCQGGKGDGTFKISLPFLERIIATGVTQKNLEKTLPTFANEGKVSFSYNDATKDHDLPSYEITYTFLKNGAPNGAMIARIDGSIKSAITGINVLDISSLQADNLAQALKNSGYLYRQSASSKSNRYYSKKGIYVSINRRDDFGYNFSISKP